MKNINLKMDTSLTVFNIAEAYNRFTEVFQNSDTIEIDLNNINDCDTSGIQLLYSLIKSCMDTGKEISIKNPSAAVHEALDRISITREIFSK
jgi:ABC-type transporter Mla MlaB component